MMEAGKRLMLSESCQLILEYLLQSQEEDFTRLLDQDLKDLQEDEAELSRFELHFLILLQALSTRKTSLCARLFQEGNNWSALPKLTGGNLSTRVNSDCIAAAADFAHSLERSGLVKVPVRVLKYLDFLAEKRRKSRKRRISSKSKEGKMELESENGESTCQQARMEQKLESGETRSLHLWRSAMPKCHETGLGLQEMNMEVEAETEASKRDQAVQTTDTQYAVVSKIYMPRARKAIGIGPLGKQVVRSNSVEEASRALFVAVERNDIKRVRAALKAGADMSWRWYGCTSLLLASASGYNEVIDVLLEYGASVEEPEASGDRPLHFAVRWARPSTVERLVAAGANLTAPGQAGRTPLHIAAREGNPDIISILLKAGAPIECATVNGNRALHFAAMCGKNEAVARLVGSGADIHAKGEFGKTPLQLASACGQQSTVQLLRSLMEPK